jgi:hypothetical protein
MADRKLITCPETARLAEIELERTSLGVVIASCSRFVPRCEVACTRECAKRIDGREHADEDDRAERVLVVYADEGEGIARTLSDKLARDGFTVELADASVAMPPPPEDYDAVVIGARGRIEPMTPYLREHRRTLSGMPTFLFSHGGPEIERLSEDAGWRPTECATFDGAAALPQTEIADFALRIADLVPPVEPIAIKDQEP